MQYGFSYNGIHCNDMHCTYVPTASKRWVLPSYDTVSSEVTERDGGYYYRTRQNIRTFSLDCFFEDITEKQLRKITKWLDRKTSGELVFDDRPDVVYRVRPSKQIEPEIYEHLLEGNKQNTYSGTFTATFSAYEPFGFLTKQSYDMSEDPNPYIAYCGMIREDQMPIPPLGTNRNILVYNCGTEPCGAYISLRGSAPNGFVITNMTNGSSCRILGMPPDPLLLVIDSENCRVMYGDGKFLSTAYTLFDGTYVLIDENNYALYEKVGEDELELNEETIVDAFNLHDEGYILLDSYDEIYRDVQASWTSGSNAVYIESDEVVADKDLIGKYILLNNRWNKIVDVLEDGSLIMMDRFETADSQSAMITTMNELVITGDGLDLNAITVTCIPKVL